MKHLLIALCLLISAAPLYAGDEDGDGTRIPDYQELIREGYGPSNYEREILYRQYTAVAAKPTQAYYAKGYTVYYGYTPVKVPASQTNTVYAFGYPVDYFKKAMPSLESMNLNQYASVVRNYHYGPGDYLTQARTHHGDAVTSVRNVAAKTTTTTTTTTTAAGNGTNPLPPIGEKPSH